MSAPADFFARGRATALRFGDFLAASNLWTSSATFLVAGRRFAGDLLLAGAGFVFGFADFAADLVDFFMTTAPFRRGKAREDFG